ncbi:hypothetical protein HRU45_00390 [Candidatus Dependentiae bacterium]|nr:hypothetical protein [Candidatus Dependentiae bacterium]
MKKKLLILFLVLIGNNVIHPSVMGSNTIAPQWSFQSAINLDELTLKLKEFAQLYQQRPIKDNIGGMRSIGQFWVWYMIKTIQPDLIIESGIWKGQSTWLLEQAAPNAKIISIDPNLHLRRYISPKVTYHQKDFSKIDFGDISSLTTCCFFDDHQDVFLRIMQAYEKGFTHLIFDDNNPREIGGPESLELGWVNGKMEKIKHLVKCYQILPQLIGTIANFGGKDFEIQSLNLLGNEPYLNIHKNDAELYRATTYIRLHQTELITS